MLHLIRGTYNLPKREFIDGEILRSVAAGKKPVLIVPEQAIFVRERGFLLSAGSIAANKITVTPFSRLLNTLAPDAEVKLRPAAGKAARNVIMSLACEDASDNLEIYSKYSRSPGLVSRLVAQYDEIRNAGADTALLQEASMCTEDEGLGKKTRELARIFAAFEALENPGYSDAGDVIGLTEDYLREHNFLAGRDVFIDDFRGFTGAQLKLVKQMLLRADNVWVSVYAPAEEELSSEEIDNRAAFAHARRAENPLKQYARDNGIEVGVSDVPGDGESAVMKALHGGFYAAAPKEYVFEGQTGDVTVTTAPDRDGECRLIAAQIRELTEKEGITCSQIAVVCRDESYIPDLTAALERCSLPVFRDTVAPLGQFPVVKLLSGALELAVSGFDTPGVFSYLKCGLDAVPSSEISALEEYAFIWNIRGNQWTEDFTKSPFGLNGGNYAPSAADAARELEKLNRIRRAFIDPVVRLRDRLSDSDARGDVRAMWDYLEEVQANRLFKEYAQKLFDGGDEKAALACSDVWDKLIGLLDTLYELAGDRTVRPERMLELYNILLENTSDSSVPLTVDEIVIGTADRIRFGAPAAVFLAGCIKDVFPALTENTGLFSPAEKRKLNDNFGFGFESVPELAFDEERIITCAAVFAPSRRLYVSYPLRDYKGASCEPSEIVDMTVALVPDCRRVTPENCGELYRICSPETAYCEYASVYGSGTVLEKTLRQYCEGAELLASRLPLLDSAAAKAPLKFADEKNAAEFFGDVITVSPSKAETYFKCPFEYFCEYGLRINPPERAEFSAMLRGDIIHYVLEMILKDHGKEEFTALTDEQIRQYVDRRCTEYVTRCTGGADMGATFERDTDNARRTLLDIIKRLQTEYSKGGFIYAGSELSINDREGAAAKPYEIELDGGAKMRLTGKVDRADVYVSEETGKTYLKIVDYKAGGKEFEPVQLINGINLQMPIYLFSLIKNGIEPYKDAVPAAFLYCPAKGKDALTDKKAKERNSRNEDIEQEIRSKGRLFGITLGDDEIRRELGAVEVRTGRAITDPGLVTPSETLTENQFGYLEHEICARLSDMGNSVRRGETLAVPLDTGISGQPKLACEYCKFNDVCRREKTDKTGKMKKFSDVCANEYQNDRGNTREPKLSEMLDEKYGEDEDGVQ